MTLQDTTQDRTPATVGTLDELVDFDRVFTVHEDGTRSYPDDVQAPGYVDDVVQGDGWSTWSDGYTRQHGYRGPVMHPSESLGGGMARDMLADPGTYVLTVAYWTPEDDAEDDGPDADGWVVLRRTEDGAL